MKICTLVRAKDKPLVLDQRTANRAPVAVVVVSRLSRNRSRLDCLLGEIIDRIEVAVLRVPLAGSMPGVGSGLGHQIELPPGGVSVFRTELICLQRKF